LLTFNSVGSVCSGSAQPGAVALRDALMPRFQGCFDVGIYNCRGSSAGGSLSTHAEGRAWDAGFPGECHSNGFALATFLIANAAHLGVQRIIWCRKNWGGIDSQGNFKDYWVPYGGPHPHTDHLHIELTWHAAKTLTRQAIELLFAQQQQEEEGMQKVMKASWGGSRHDIFGIGYDAKVYHAWSEGGTDWGFEELPHGGYGTHIVGVSSNGPQHYVVFIRGTDGCLHRAEYRGYWQGWRRIGSADNKFPEA
jgi:hypothetical protein